MNADEHRSLGSEYGVTGFPTLKIFGLDKNNPDKYSGGRTAADMVDGVLKAAKEKAQSVLGGKSSGGSSKVNETVTTGGHRHLHHSDTL